MRAFFLLGSFALAGAAASAVALRGASPLDLRAHRIGGPLRAVALLPR